MVIRNYGRQLWNYPTQYRKEQKLVNSLIQKYSRSGTNDNTLVTRANWFVKPLHKLSLTNMLYPFLATWRLGPAHLLLQTVCGEFVLEPAGSPQTDKKSQINSRCIANETLAVCSSHHCFKLVWTNVEWFDKPVSQFARVTGALRSKMCSLSV